MFLQKNQNFDISESQRFEHFWLKLRKYPEGKFFYLSNSEIYKFFFSQVFEISLKNEDFFSSTFLAF